MNLKGKENETQEGEFHHRDSNGDWYFGCQMPPGKPLPGHEPNGWVHIRFVPIDSRPVVVALLQTEIWQSIVDHISKHKGTSK